MRCHRGPRGVDAVAKPRVDILDRGDSRSITMRRWGRFVYRRRRAVLGVSLAFFVLSMIGLLTGGQPINASNYDVESVRAANLEGAQAAADDRLVVHADPHQQTPHVRSTCVRVGSRRSRRSAAERFTRQCARNAVQRSGNDSAIDGLDRQTQRPRPGGTEDRLRAGEAQYGSIRGEVKPSGLSITATGDVPLAYDFDTYLANDLRRSEVVSLPLALILLVIVFCTGVAALLCLGVGVFAVLGGVGAALPLRTSSMFRRMPSTS